MRRVVVLLALAALVAGTSMASAAPWPSDDGTLPDPAVTNLDGLQQTLSSLIGDWNGDVAVSVTDLETGESISVNGDRPQSAASTIKLFIAMRVAQDVADGRYPASDVEQAMHDMMALSDNEAAWELLAEIGDDDVAAGIGRVNDLMRGLGLTGSVLNCPPDFPGYCVVPDDNYLTADDLTLALARLYRGAALSSDATTDVLQQMTQPEDWQASPLAAPLPDNVRLYHKPGWLDDTWNDAAIVVYPHDGQDQAYALAFLDTGEESQDVAVAHLTAVSDAVWQAFSAIDPPDPASQEFSETGHAVTGDVLAYWQQNGGLAIFGYPISDAVSTSSGTVQYFERARVEAQPGEVELGRLGAEVAERRGLLATPPFQPAARQDRDDCDYAEPTGHNLCDAFRDYWNQFGGLPIYGYPISEAYVDPATGVLTQYFERARFELHPGAWPERDNVLLGRLGVEMLHPSPTAS